MSCNLLCLMYIGAQGSINLLQQLAISESQATQEHVIKALNSYLLPFRRQKVHSFREPSRHHFLNVTGSPVYPIGLAHFSSHFFFNGRTYCGCNFCHNLKLWKSDLSNYLKCHCLLMYHIIGFGVVFSLENFYPHLINLGRCML